MSISIAKLDCDKSHIPFPQINMSKLINLKLKCNTLNLTDLSIYN